MRHSRHVCESNPLEPNRPLLSQSTALLGWSGEGCKSPEEGRGNMGEAKTSIYGNARFWIAVCVTAAALFFAFLHVFCLPLFKSEPRFDGTVVGLLVAAALPWLIDRIEVLKGPGFEIKQRLDEQDGKIEKQQQLLNRMFLSSMEVDMFDTLRSLCFQSSFTHNPSDPNYKTIVEQMKDLFHRGYLTRPPEALGDSEEVGHGRLLTPLGRMFVEERMRLEKEQVSAEYL